MRYVAAYMLSVLSGKHQITVHDIENILGAVGIDCDHEQAECVLKKMQGKTVDEMIEQGLRHVASVSSSPASVTAASTLGSAGGGGGGGGEGAPAATEEKKETKKEEEKEESDDDLGFGLFD